MPSEAGLLIGKAPVDQSSLPYSAGWIDRMVGWIDRLPIPPWLFYPVLLGLIYLAISVSRWVEGSAPFGTLNDPNSFIAIYPVGALAAIHYLDGAARRAFDSFLPALGKSEAEAARLRFELTKVPSREAWIAAAAGFVFVLLLFVALGNEARQTLGSGLYFWTLFAVTGAGLVINAELLYHTLRQLRLVSRIHALAEKVDLFHLSPLYAFSGLTVRTGLVFILFLYVDLVLNSYTLVNLPLLGLNAVFALFGVACFVLPLWGMHRRIALEKRRLEWDVNQRVEAIVQHLYSKVDGLDLHDADAINKTVSSLVATRELIGKIPTWPWQPETFAAFFSALTLPVLAFMIQMFLKTLIGFK